MASNQRKTSGTTVRARGTKARRAASTTNRGRKRRAARSSAPSDAQPVARLERLQKVLASAGVGSRRACEELILAGRVEVDRRVVTELGTKVDPSVQEVRLDGVRLRLPQMVYYAVNKPPGVVSTNRDPVGRMRVVDLVPQSAARIYTVGRLDKSSEGLILLTNDGQLANQLTHPRYGVEKTYHVHVAGLPSPAELARLRRGIHLDEMFVRIARLHVKARHKNSAILEIVLDEGRNREIRRMLARLGHKVMRLRRVAVGGVRLGGLPPGACRKLSREEVEGLRRSVKRPETPENSASQHKRSSHRSGRQSQTRRARSNPRTKASAKRATRR